MRYLPNLISFLRITLVIPTVIYLWYHEFGKALLVFFVAGISDGLDGFLARRFGWITRLGSLLDPLADKLLMTAIYFTLGLMEKLPVWLVALVIGRDLVIMLGALAYRLLIRDISLHHLLISKFNTAAQILLVLLLIYHLSGFPLSRDIPPLLIDIMVYLVAVTTLASGVAYVFIWSRRARNEYKVKLP